MAEIRVLNKRDVGNRGVYVGRPSPLGNPFKLSAPAQSGVNPLRRGAVRESERVAVIDRYEIWWRECIAARDQAVCNELNRLYGIARDKDKLELMCWCVPKRCHADVIRAVLLEALAGRRQT